MKKPPINENNFYILCLKWHYIAILLIEELARQTRNNPIEIYLNWIVPKLENLKNDPNLPNKLFEKLNQWKKFNKNI
jgi:hypothetical protein